jgi:hypothetical protein
MNLPPATGHESVSGRQGFGPFESGAKLDSLRIVFGARNGF